MPIHETPDGGEAQVTAGEVAELAGVSRAAVSNWRRRFPDFPKSVATAPGGGDLFRMADVEAWLRYHGKLVGEIAVETGLWQVVDATRGTLGVDQMVQIAAAFIGLLAVDSRLIRQLSRKRPTVDVFMAIDDAVNRVEADRTDLQDLFTPLIDSLHTMGAGITPLLSAVLQLTQESSPSAAFEALLERRDRLRPYGGGEFESAPSLANLLIALSEPAGVLFDPAVGEGGFLVAAAARAKSGAPLGLVGQEISPGSRRIALLRCLVHGLSAEIHLGDSLVNDAVPDLRADVVLCDPPFGQRLRSALDPTDPRWFAGPPSEVSADLTWMEHIIYHLADGGRGYVAMPTSSMFRAGREGVIRRELVRRGCVEAVVALPSGMVRGSLSPASVWIVRRPEESRFEPVLVINAAGPTGEGRQVFDQSLLVRIVASVERFRNDPSRFAGEQGFSVAVPILDLLAPDSTLVPAHWVTDTMPPEEVLSSMRLMEQTMTVSRNEIAEADQIPQLEVKLADRARKTVKIRELVDTGAIEVIRGVAIPKELPTSPNGPPVLRSPWSRAADELERRVDLAALKGKPRLTEPGDVIVMTVGNVPRAFVDFVGGHAVPDFMQAVRIRSTALDSAVLAGLLSAPANVRFVIGATIPRLSLMEVELPMLTPDETEVLRDVLVKAGRQEALATGLSDATAAFRDRLLDAVVSGQVEVVFSETNNSDRTKAR